MGNKVSTNLFHTYIKQWTGVPPQEGESPAQHIERAVAMDSLDIPYSRIHVLENRIGFFGPILLGKIKSDIVGLLDDTENVLFVGIEASTAFVGKHSLFCAFAVESLEPLTRLFYNLNTIKNPKGVGIALHATEECVKVACPFSTFLST